MDNLSTSAADDVTAESVTEDPAAEVAESDDGQMKFDTGMLIIAVGCLGFLGNAFAMVVICNYKKMRQRQGMLLIINQCAVDLAASFFTAIVFSIRLCYGRLGSPLGGLAGDLFCRFFRQTLNWGLMASSSYNLLAITAERYVMVVHPIYHKTQIVKSKLYLVVALVWLIGPLYYAVFSVPTNKLRGFVCIFTWQSDRWRAFYGAFTTIFQFFFPTAAMAYMYVRMILALRKKVHPEIGSQGIGSRAQRNMTKIFMIVVVVFVCCWVTNQVYYLLLNLGLNMEQRKLISQISSMLVNVNCCVNPFIYIFKYQEFREGVWHLLGRKASQQQSQNSGPGQTTAS